MKKDEIVQFSNILKQLKNKKHECLKKNNNNCSIPLKKRPDRTLPPKTLCLQTNNAQLVQPYTIVQSAQILSLGSESLSVLALVDLQVQTQSEVIPI